MQNDITKTMSLFSFCGREPFFWQFRNMNQILKFYNRIHKRKWLPSQAGKEPFSSWGRKWLHGSLNHRHWRGKRKGTTLQKSWTTFIGGSWNCHLICWGSWNYDSLDSNFVLGISLGPEGGDEIVVHLWRGVTKLRCRRVGDHNIEHTQFQQSHGPPPPPHN